MSSFALPTPPAHACRLFVASLLLSGGLAQHAAAATPPPLTLAYAQQLAMAHSRQLPAFDAAATAAREMAVAAGQLPDPVLKVGVDNLPVNGVDRFSLGNDFMTMRRVGVMQELTSAEKRQLRSARLEREAEKSEAEKSAGSAAILRDTALAWLERYYAEQMRDAAAAQVGLGRQEIDATEAAWRGGRASPADLLAARSALASMEDRLSELTRRVRNAGVMLARWTGAAEDQPLAGRPAFDQLRLMPDTLEQALLHHPQIDVLVKREEMAAADARLAQANKKADWSMEFAFQQRGAGYSNMVSLGVSLPLQWDQKNRQDREVSARLAGVEQARGERVEALRQHVAETRAMLNEWDSGRARMARFEAELIPLAAKRSEAVLADWRSGKASLAELLAARRNEIEVRIQALTLQADTARLWAQLNFLTPDHAALPAALQTNQIRERK
jgi:outer membrane protein TolC